MESMEREMNQLIAISKDIVFNENEETSARLSGVRILIEDCNLKIRKNQIGLERLHIQEKKLVEKLITEYRERRIVEFMIKFGNDQQELTPELIVEMRKIDKPAHCYCVEGITIIESDCNLCKKRSCELSGATFHYNLIETEDKPERPMDGLEDEPPPDIAKDMEDDESK